MPGHFQNECLSAVCSLQCVSKYFISTMSTSCDTYILWPSKLIVLGMICTNILHKFEKQTFFVKCVWLFGQRLLKKLGLSRLSCDLNCFLLANWCAPAMYVSVRKLLLMFVCLSEIIISHILPPIFYQQTSLVVLHSPIHHPVMNPTVVNPTLSSSCPVAGSTYDPVQPKAVIDLTSGCWSVWTCCFQ